MNPEKLIFACENDIMSNLRQREKAIIKRMQELFKLPVPLVYITDLDPAQKRQLAVKHLRIAYRG